MPSVSIIVPCFNEQKTIANLLQAIHAQTFPRADLEVVIADGMSTDGTRAEIAAFAAAHPDLSIRVVDNPRRIIPAGLNCALRASYGEIVVRLDGHSMPKPGYVARCVADLQAGLGKNVGGVWEIEPGARNWVARAIAAAAAHPLGVGDALYRHAEHASAVDTVPFGAFRRELLEQVGYFDESLLSNEDYEFNARIRKAGGVVWLDPAIRSQYVARASLPELARQYQRYGFWKWRMLRRYPKTLRWRQALPPLFVLSLLGLGIAALFIPFARLLLLVEVALYAAALGAAGLLAALKRRRASLVLGLPLAISVMHISWGAGFIWSMIKGSMSTQLPEKD
jgi:succinoglycan biosynthesis protein ExoA